MSILLEEVRIMRLLHDLSVRIEHLEQLLGDINHMLGRVEPLNVWAQHEIDAYRERIKKELTPPGDLHEKGTHSSVEQVGPLGAPK